VSRIHDVAKFADVSVATVSRVLNNSDKVSSETREKVLDAISSMNYHPNMLGRNLRRSSSNAILTLVPNISNSFYSKIVKGIQDKLDENNYQLLLANTDAKWDVEKKYIKLLEQKLVDGLIWMDATADSEEVHKISRAFPVVICSQYDANDLSYVSIDNEKAAYDAVTHLVNKGYKRIALFNSDLKFRYARLRLQGYKKALLDCHIPYDESLVTYVDFDEERTIESVKRMLDQPKPIDSVFTISDIIAQYVYKAVSIKGKKVGIDFGIVGFDNLEFSNVITPSLTTVDQPRYRIGTEAARLMLDKIEGKTPKRTRIILDYDFLVRDSSQKK
jgi:LacI family repressor for deo operon, udp, cdd, tsx, nupC, and nupG